MKSKALFRVLTAAIAVTGILAGVGNDALAKEATGGVVNPVYYHFDVMEYGIIPIGTQVNTIIPVIESEGVELKNKVKVNGVDTYVRYARKAVGSDQFVDVGNYATAEVPDSITIESGYDYRVEFVYQTTGADYKLPNPEQYTADYCKHCRYNNGSQYSKTPVSDIGYYQPDSGLMARKAMTVLYAINQGSKTLDFNDTKTFLINQSADGNQRIVFSLKDSDTKRKSVAYVQANALAGTLGCLSRAAKTIGVQLNTGNNGADYDLDNDNTWDVSVTSNTDQTVYYLEVLPTCSIKGSWTGVVPMEKMPSGVALDSNIVYSKLTIRFPESQSTEEPKNISGATAAPIEKQVYTGKEITPKVTLTMDGVTLKEGEDFSVAFQDNVNVGKGFAVATGCGKYKGTKIVSFEIVKAGEQGGSDDIAAPAAPEKAPSLKSTKKKTISVSWKKVENAKGYEIAYCLKRNFKKGVVTKTSKKPSIKLKKLKSKKNYWVMVRAFVTDADGKKVYGAWSKAKKVKVK